MQRIIQITIGGMVIPIEERAYTRLSDYINSLEMHFAGEAGKNEIIDDIEARIAELFSIRLQSGAQAIDGADVQKVIETLGNPTDLGMEEPLTGKKAGTGYQHYQYEPVVARRLYRNPNDKILGGVCSGLANYFDIDPVIVRLVFAILFLTMGVGLLAYIIAWIIIPAARTPQEMYYMTGGAPMDFHTMKKNMGVELQDLKKRGEEMSQELKDFFSKKKTNG